MKYYCTCKVTYEANNMEHAKEQLSHDLLVCNLIDMFRIVEEDSEDII